MSTWPGQFLRQDQTLLAFSGDEINMGGQALEGEEVNESEKDRMERANIEICCKKDSETYLKDGMGRAKVKTNGSAA